MIELYFLLGFMIVGAIIAVQVKDLLSAVIAVGMVGLGLSWAFLVLKAPDLAMVQMVFEIVALVILIRATIKRDTSSSRTGTGRLIIATTLIFIVVFMVFVAGPLRELPAFGEPTMRVASKYLRNGMADTGCANIVTGIILDYRAYDTLGEATVLITGVVGALAIMRQVGRKKIDQKVELEDE